MAPIEKQPLFDNRLARRDFVSGAIAIAGGMAMLSFPGRASASGRSTAASPAPAGASFVDSLGRSLELPGADAQRPRAGRLRALPYNPSMAVGYVCGQVATTKYYENRLRLVPISSPTAYSNISSEMSYMEPFCPAWDLL